MELQTPEYLEQIARLESLTVEVTEAVTAGDWDLVLSLLEQRAQVMSAADGLTAEHRVLSEPDRGRAQAALSRLLALDEELMSELRTVAAATRQAIEESARARSTASVYQKVGTALSEPQQARFVDKQS